MKGSGRIRYEYNGQQGSEKNTEDHSDSGGDNSVYHHLYRKCAESVHPGHKRGIRSQRRKRRMAHNGIYTGGSGFFGTHGEAGGRDMHETCPGGRHSGIYPVLRRCRVFGIFRGPDDKQDGAGYRCSHDIQYQCGGAYKCIPAGEKRTGTGLFTGIHICRTFSRTGGGRHTGSCIRMEIHIHIYRRTGCSSSCSDAAWTAFRTQRQRGRQTIP